MHRGHVRRRRRGRSLRGVVIARRLRPAVFEFGTVAVILAVIFRFAVVPRLIVREFDGVTTS